jgi:hypothetical protein
MYDIAESVRDVMCVQRLLYLIVGIFCVALLPFSCMSARASSGLEIKNVSMQLTGTRPPIGNKEIHIYTISVLVYNDDVNTSDAVSVFFRDPEPGLNSSMQLVPSNVTLASGESKTFTFSDWPTTLTGSIMINFSFKPSSHSTVPTMKNTGYYLYSFTVPSANTKKATPGFELLLLLGAFAVLIVLRKRKF